MEMLGLTPVDIHNIEYLEDREVLKALPGGFRWLKRNVREDVIVYFETFASILEVKLAADLQQTCDDGQPTNLLFQFSLLPAGFN